MIEYDDIYGRDAHLYFREAPVFIVDTNNPSNVTPWILHVDELHEEECLLDVDVGLSSCTTGRFKSVPGDWLFAKKGGYILQRLPIEYVVVDGVLTRYMAAPTQRFAFKGTYVSQMTVLPPVSVGGVDRSLLPVEDAPLYRSNVTADRMASYLGVAEVLSLGMPSCMRNYISLDEAKDNARAAVRECLLSTSGKAAVVPDFPLAVLRTGTGVGLVLRRGAILGTVRVKTSDDALVFTPSNIKAPRKALEAAVLGVVADIVNC